MGEPEYQTRFLREVGTRAWLRTYWGVHTECPGHGYHNAMIFLADSDKLDDYELGGKAEDYPEERWPTKCDYCDAATPPESALVPCTCGDPTCTAKRMPDGVRMRQVFHRRLYQADDGSHATRRIGPVVDEFQIGDLYYVRWHEPSETCYHGWTNCDGRHLVCEIPDSPGRTHPWDIDGRASNCGSRDDTTHRCWVRHGRPELGELVTVDKAIPGVASETTCVAGAGSIDNNGKWHGFLHSGRLHI